jgi:hypothetical protein
MKNIKLLILSMILLNMNFIFVNAEVKGAADIYKIRMHKLELCTGHTAGNMDLVASSTTQCQGAVTIGNSTAGVEVDIASVDKGAVAGNFGDAMILPLGETYTHARVTINRQMKLRTEEAINTTGGGSVDECMTIATTDAMYVTDEATDKYTHKPVVAEGGNSGASEEMSLYIYNGQQVGDGANTFSLCQNASCGSVSADGWNYAAVASELTSALAMQTMRSSVSTDQLSLIYALESPYTVALISPQIDMSFSTSQGIMAKNEVSNSFCSFAITEPTVTITIK